MTDLTSLESVPKCHWNRARLLVGCANSHVFRCPLAQFERRFIDERTRDGVNAARAKGSRPKVVDAVWTLFPANEFVDEIFSGNKEMKAHREEGERQLVPGFQEESGRGK